MYEAHVSATRAPTSRLQEACSRALGPLPAPMPHRECCCCTQNQEVPGGPFHDPFHAATLGAAHLRMSDLGCE